MAESEQFITIKFRAGADEDYKLWRDLYYLFQDMFTGKMIVDELVVTREEVAQMLLDKYGKFLVSLRDIEEILKKYFNYTGAHFTISRKNYFLLIHEIHNPALPAELLPANYKHNLKK